MAFTQTDVDNLDEAYKGGEKRVVTSDGKAVEFHSVDDYVRLRQMMLAEVLGVNRKPSSFSVGRITR